jgi:hypothetical protein
MAPELLAHVAVHPEVVEEIIALEDAVVLAHPVQLLVGEGLDDRRGNIRVIECAERVADVVKQRHHDIILRFPAAMGASRGLKRVLEAVDREPAIVAVEQLQMGQDPVGKALGIREEMASDGGPVLGRAVVHAAERRARSMFVHPCLSRGGTDCRFLPLLAMADLPLYIPTGNGDR